MFAYAGRIAFIDLTSQRIHDLSTTDYVLRFMGGRGIATKVYWDHVHPDTDPFDPKNLLIFMTGPLGGIPGVAGSRWLVCGKSPVTHPPHFLCSNFGGRWGAALKSSGFDGLIVTGRSEKPVFLMAEAGAISFRNAVHLWGKDTIQTRELLKAHQGDVAVAAIGPAGENRVPSAIMLADDDSSGSGLAAVMGAKRLKAIAVRSTQPFSPQMHDGDAGRALTRRLRQLKPDGSVPYFGWMQLEKPAQGQLKRQVCYGCISGCNRLSYTSATGEKGKVLCTAGDFYKPLARSFYGELNEVPFQATRLCDRYGIDIMFIQSIARWLRQCHSHAIVTEQEIGMPISQIGSLEFIESLVRQISLRQGFGNVLADGLAAAARVLGSKAQALLMHAAYDKTDRPLTYSPKLYLPHALFYALELKKPSALLHRIVYTLIPWKFWNDGLSGAVMSGNLVRQIMKSYWDFDGDFSSATGQAALAKAAQNRVYAQDNLVLCDKAWSIVYTGNTSEPLIDPDLETKLLYVATGRKMDTPEFLEMGERVFTLQRAIHIREGHRGAEDDVIPESVFSEPLEREHQNEGCEIPGQDGVAISRKGAVLDRGEFNSMLRGYYDISGWDSSGYPRPERLLDLGLGEVAAYAVQHRRLPV